MQLARRPYQSARRLATLGIALLLLLGGSYILLTALSPLLSSPFINPTDNATTRLLATSATKPPAEQFTEPRLYIPKIDINLPYASGGPEVMERGAWWRQPHNGNPKDGGNFVLSAHRFIMGLTPQQTWRKSPFYNIHLLTVGDEIIIDYQGQRYIYVIRRLFDVTPDAVHIEQRTEQPQLTLYSCTLGGAADGRNVIIATLK